MNRLGIGRIFFIGGGPGDPGLLTSRALGALHHADHIIYDPELPPRLVEEITRHAPAEVQVSVAEGGSVEVSEKLLAAARDGLTAIRIVRGDPGSRQSIVDEIAAVAEGGLSFEVVPGLGVEAVAGYAGVPLGATRTLMHIADAVGMSDAYARNIVDIVEGGESLSVVVPALQLFAFRDRLNAAGMKPGVPLCLVADGSKDVQSSVKTTFGDLIEASIGMYGRLHIFFGPGVAHHDALSWWESRPLFGWKVLVPRTKEQAGVMTDQLRVYGAIPTEVPTIAVELPRTPAQMERAVKGLVTGRYEWVILTSANAVRAIWEKFSEFGLDARAFAGVKIACVGDKTAEAVRKFGINPELIPSGEQSSEGLLADFPPYDSVLDPINRVLLPRADIATEALSAGLTARGWEVDDVTAYRTVRASPPPAEIRDAIKSGGFDAVLFTSSSTVRNLVGIAGKPHARTIISCIGPKTAETARELGLRVDIQPDKPDAAELVESLADFAIALKQERAANPVKKPRRRGAPPSGPSARFWARSAPESISFPLGYVSS